MPSKEKPLTDKTRSRGWCFTLQSWTEEDSARAMELYEMDNNCLYLIVGFEISPRTEKHHQQCYIYYRDAISFSTMKNKLENVHIEPQKSKLNVKAYCYCMEDGDWVEFGSRPRQGHRTDLEVIRHDMVDKKKPMLEIADQYFSQWCQYRRSFDAYADLKKVYTYQTKLIVYNNDTIELIYKNYPLNTSYIFQGDHMLLHFDIWHADLLHKYYSKKYEYIFLPKVHGIEKVDHLVHEVLY